MNSKEITIEEAMECLKRNKPTSDTRECGKELCEAVDLAIEALEDAEKYRWHYLQDENETEREPEIVVYSESFNCSEAVEVTDGYGIYDTAMIVENHVEGDCNKVYERFWFYGTGGKWDEMSTIRAWRYIKTFKIKEQKNDRLTEK